MQYGVEILPYQRTKKLKREGKKQSFKELSAILKIAFYFTASFLVARVMLINLMAPFGIAFLIAAIYSEKGKVPIAVGIGTFLGYISLYNNVKNLPLYFIITATLMFMSYILKPSKSKKIMAIIFLSIFIESAFYKILIVKTVYWMAFLTSFFEIACIFPLYFIINYSIICFKELNTRHLYSSEEIISMAITVSIMVAGTWGTSIHGISLRSIVALTFILIIGFVKGCASGAAVGVAMGSIIGVTSNDMVMFIGVYGLCGLISGVFRETGKWITAVAYLVGFAVIKMYSEIGVDFKIIEVLISSVVFVSIPIKYYRRIEVELDWQKKQEHLKDNYAEKIKAILLNKLESFSDVLFNMSDILEKLADNHKLAMKNKSSALVENLADRVCSTCTLKSMCWKRESFYTYNAFSELIENYQQNKKHMPNELNRKCIKRGDLSKHTKDIVNNYIIDEMWRGRLGECRELLASQIDGMAKSIREIIKEFDENIKFNTDAENDIRRILNKNNIHYRDIFCFNDKNNKLIIRVSMDACGGKQLCIKEILPLINEVTGKCMCVSDEGCSVDSLTKGCNVAFEETPRYHVAAYANRSCKDGEKSNGDSYTFGKLSDGTYMTIISDGMGSGAQAGEESGAAVKLIEKFAKAGFSKLTAINTVNSIMTMKFSEDEKFSTLDLNSIDLYAGEVDFMKVGAVASFIKRGDDVEVIDSKTLPIGVLDKPDIDITRKKIKNGDLIIMISDGVLDYNNESVGRVDWIMDFLRSTNCSDPKEMCDKIMQKAKELSGGKVKDDMTAVVEKIYGLY